MKEISSYQFIDDLRRVNNDLKHSLKINASKQIKEFKGKTKFDSESLDTFLKLASYEIESFFNLLIKKINDEDVVELGDNSFLGDIPFSSGRTPNNQFKRGSQRLALLLLLKV